VSSYISSLIPNFHEAEDVLQDVAVKLQQKFHRYDPSQSFIGWVVGFTRNEILMSRRTHARSFITFDTELMDSLASSCEEMTPELEQRGVLLRECLSEVKNQVIRRVLELRYVADLPGGEIAKKMKMNHSAVRVMLHRVRKALRDCVERKFLLLGESM